MPQPGEIRHGATESVQWDGTRWQPLAPPAPLADASVPMYHPGLSDSPTDAMVNEGLRTATEAAKGVAESPWDALTGTAHAIAHPLDTLMGLGHTIAHPVEAAEALGNDPKAAGSLLGQLLLGKVVGPEVPGAARTALEESPGVVGRGVSKVGRGIEAVGTSPAVKRMGTFGGLGEMIYHRDPYGALIAAAPKALEMTGRGLQKIGGGIEGLKLAAKAVPEAPPTVISGLTLDKDALARNIEATNMTDEGFSHAQAGKLAGIPGAGESKLVSNISHLPQVPESSVDEIFSDAAGNPSTRRVFNKGAGTESYQPEAEPAEEVAPRPEGDASPFTRFWEDRAPAQPAAGAPPYDPLTELNPDAVERGYQQNNPVFRSLEGRGLFGGDRTPPQLGRSIDFLKAATTEEPATPAASAALETPPPASPYANVDWTRDPVAEGHARIDRYLAAQAAGLSDDEFNALESEYAPQRPR